MYGMTKTKLNYNNKITSQLKDGNVYYVAGDMPVYIQDTIEGNESLIPVILVFAIPEMRSKELIKWTGYIDTNGMYHKRTDKQDYALIRTVFNTIGEAKEITEEFTGKPCPDRSYTSFVLRPDLKECNRIYSEGKDMYYDIAFAESFIEFDIPMTRLKHNISTGLICSPKNIQAASFFRKFL